MVQSNPQLSAMLSDPMMLQMLNDPAIISSALSMMGGMGGMGGNPFASMMGGQGIFILLIFLCV